MAQLTWAALVEDPNDPGTFIIQNMPFTDNPNGSNSPDDYGDGVYPTLLSWGNVGERYYETGVDRGVLYLDGESGVAWNGLVSISETPSGGEPTPYYLDGVKYVNHATPEEFEAKIEAYTYPDEFARCDGSELIAQGLFITQQRRQSFGMSYRTRVGNDVDGTDHGYKIHIVYDAMAVPSERDYQSLNDDPEALTFSWDLTTTPKKFADAAFGSRISSHVVVDSRKTYPWAMEAVEKVLYGDVNSNPRLPTPQELIALFVDNALLQITDNGDGTWTAVGPDEAITMLSADEFQIDWESAVMIDENSYHISSL